MKALTCTLIVGALGLTAALGVNQTAGSETLINRRDQARADFLSTPQGMYGHYCAHCHGDDGTGNGRLWALELTPAPADLTSLKTDQEAIAAFIRDGSAAQGKSSLCPPWGRTLSSANLQRLARYVAALSAEDSPTPAQSSPPSKVAGESFPWLLSIILLAEVAALWRIGRKGH